MKPSKTCPSCGLLFNRRFDSVCCSNACNQKLRAGDHEDRFWSKVSVGNPDECHLWRGIVSAGGYGQFWYGKSMKAAHRLAWMFKKGPIPKSPGYHGTCVCHKCDNRLCMNVDHMFLGTQRDNVQDAQRKGRMRTNPMFGETNPMAKLTEEIVLKIMTFPENNRQTAKAFDVSPMTVGRIRRRELWTEVTGKPC